MKFICILLFFVSYTSISQTSKGTIKDEGGYPIQDVYISNLRSNEHSHTNELGKFSILKTELGDVLSFSKLGYKTQEFTLGSDNEELLVVLEIDVVRLSEVVLYSNINTTNTLSKIDLLINPVNSSQEILRKVPGLFIGQHAGGGKAEQLFIRGFDIDHGTDVAINVDGIPVNMVSHAHGQGYADLHFLIPETVEKIDFGKGPYFAKQGDFATAAYVNFSTKNKITKSTISQELGQFNSSRTVGLFNLLDNKNQSNAYIATEYILFDGPFDSPQNFNRFNVFGKYNTLISSTSKVTLQASHFSSKWTASGQIPDRLVENGTISRFGAVDPTEGGNTSRTNINVISEKIIDEQTFVKSNVFYSKYDFSLFSNFTFFLEDPINGDQIHQLENRTIYGLNSQLNKKIAFEKFNLNLQSGIGFRVDNIKNSGLSHTLNRKTILNRIQFGDVDQSNLFGYVTAEFQYNKFKIAPSIRVDYFKFLYDDQLADVFSIVSNTKIKASPKLNFTYSQNNSVEYYLKSGLGFHSNDTRVVLQEMNKVLPAVFGVDLGTTFKPFKNIIVNTAVWSLFSEQEFVYVGDAGVVEPSDKSQRFGYDFGLRYQLNDYLFFDFDGTYTFARSIDGLNNENYIPLAPKVTATGALSLNNYKRFSGSFNYRYLGDRSANEDNSVVAKGYFVSDFTLNYTINSIQIGLTIENVFNTKWNETQFLTESQLQNESQSVEEIHFTPGTPFFSKIKIAYNF
jgi:TonB-dependent Receptor Plug Domain